jgi:DNA repair protein RadC
MRKQVTKLSNKFGRVYVQYVREPDMEEYGTKLDSPEAARDYINKYIQTDIEYDPTRESLWVILLNTRYGVIGHNLVSIGSVNESIADPRMVMRPAVVANCFGILLFHNHPGQNPDPSESDRAMTKKILECCTMFRIRLLDHIILGDHSNLVYSFKEHGLL